MSAKKRDTDDELRSMAHWALQRQREPMRQNEHDQAEFVEMQAMFCPHYVPLESPWGGDWGAILHPQSVKFGQLVFEHEWCGCGYHPGES